MTILRFLYIRVAISQYTAPKNNIQCTTLWIWKMTVEDLEIKSVRHSQRTSTLEFEVSFPTLFLATHWYSPLSVLLIFVIVNRLLSFERPILDLLFMGDPSLTQDIDGSGFPVALQDRVIFSPSLRIFPSGRVVIRGSSV